MDRKPLPVGIDIFERLIQGGYYFVDKTNLIRDLLDMKGAVNLFTRPRRFGKTLNMTMLKSFFEDARDKNGEKIDNSGLFSGLNILCAGEEYLFHMGRYPVIFLTLKEGRQNTPESAYRQIAFQIGMEYRRHGYLMDSELLAVEERKRYQEIAYGSAGLEEYKASIQFLSECLEKYHGRKVIILIDEYDVPLENAFVRGFYEEMADDMRSLLGAALKTNPSLEFAVITGCLRVSKESIFTGMNNLEVISILSSKYDEYFGFTAQEVMEICRYYGLFEEYEGIREWYNGYVFGEADIYNPWSVVMRIKDLRYDSPKYPKSYWANTSSNSIVRELIDVADESVKEEIECLIGGGTIEKPIHEDVTYGEIYENMDNLWNFMFFAGYFCKVGERFDEEQKQSYLTLKIPNSEIEYIFRNKIRSWFEEQIRRWDRTRLHKAFIQKDAAVVEEELADIMLETISSMDEHENYYHGLVAGLLTGMKGYITKSNRESGRGRSDLFVKPLSRRKEAFIVEFKVAKKLKNLEAKAEEALAQIRERNYDRELEDDNYSKISHYGIAFCGKDCAVRLVDDKERGGKEKHPSLF